MSKHPNFRTPQNVARELGVSPATLRRWSEEFSDFISQEAGSPEGRNHRRYTDDDLATLELVQELMSNGMTYEQVRQHLANQFSIWSGIPSDTSRERSADGGGEDGLTVTEPEEEKGLVASNGSESPAIAFLTNTLATLSDSQKSILNSQAANRELLGVLIQDNFNLKEENNRLRERILEIERSLAQARQESEWRQEALRQELDAKIGVVQRLATEAITTAKTTQPPEIKAIKSKPGCLGSLLGGRGDMQIVTVPRGRGREEQKGGRPASSPLRTPPPYSVPPYPGTPPPQPSSPIHPKPTSPPE